MEMRGMYALMTVLVLVILLREGNCDDQCRQGDEMVFSNFSTVLRPPTTQNQEEFKSSLGKRIRFSLILNDNRPLFVVTELSLKLSNILSVTNRYVNRNNDRNDQVVNNPGDIASVKETPTEQLRRITVLATPIDGATPAMVTIDNFKACFGCLLKNARGFGDFSSLPRPGTTISAQDPETFTSDIGEPLRVSLILTEDRLPFVVVKVVLKLTNVGRIRVDFVPVNGDIESKSRSNPAETITVPVEGTPVVKRFFVRAEPINLNEPVVVTFVTMDGCLEKQDA